MKSLIAIALLSLSVGAFSAEKSCVEKCASDANQTSLRCHKISQICYRWPAETPAFDMCMEDVYACHVEGKKKLEACVKECEQSK